MLGALAYIFKTNVLVFVIMILGLAVVAVWLLCYVYVALVPCLTRWWTPDNKTNQMYG